MRAIDRTPKGHIRLETAFAYPDGGSIDLFLREDSQLTAPGFRAKRLSDFGATLEWLLDVQVKPWLSKKRQGMLEDAIRMYGVTQDGGALETEVRSWDELADKVVLLGQACVRVSDLTFTRRISLQAPVVEEIEEVLMDVEVRYEPNVELTGMFGRPVRVDLLAHGRQLDCAILSLASANTSAAHTQANEIFRRWFDLTVPDRKEQKVTVFDDRYNAYREEDLTRLSKLSHVVPLSDRQAIEDLVAA